MSKDVLDALFGKPDYSHIARDVSVTVDLTAAEVTALLGAYDRGLDALDAGDRQALDSLIAKLKDEVWP